MDPRSVCVLAWCALALLIAQPARGQGAESTASDRPARTYRLTGVVTDAAREPISEAQVAVIESGTLGRATATDARGRFELAQLTSGTLSFRVRRLGYQERTLAVQIGSSGPQTSVEIVLAAVPAELEEVSVTSAPLGRLQEFYQRRQQRGTFGKFMVQEEIRRISPMNASELFRGIPGIRISTNPAAGGNAIRIRNCQPMVWVDAQRVPGAELDEVVIPGDIAAIEFYPSSAGAPAQYMERGNRLCGLILVWSKSK